MFNVYYLAFSLRSKVSRRVRALTPRMQLMSPVPAAVASQLQALGVWVGKFALLVAAYNCFRKNLISS
jgi:hypothetical protein